MSLSETQGQMFTTSSHVASLAFLLIPHHQTNMYLYLLGPKTKQKSIPQETFRERQKSKHFKNSYRDAWPAHLVDF